jgi:uncharacterized protein (DUF433 family)
LKFKIFKIKVPFAGPQAMIEYEKDCGRFVRASYSNGRSSENMPKKHRRLLGRHMVADPEICHGKPTFLGTRIMVAQVLRQVAKGMPWDAITAEWRGTVTAEAIAEAVALAQRTFEDHADEYTHESLPA